MSSFLLKIEQGPTRNGEGSVRATLLVLREFVPACESWAIARNKSDGGMSWGRTWGEGGTTTYLDDRLCTSGGGFLRRCRILRKSIKGFAHAGTEGRGREKVRPPLRAQGPDLNHI